MLLATLLPAIAARTPHKIALRFGDRAWSYAELDAESTRAALNLLDAGVAVGDRVGLFLPNCPEFVLAYYACFKAGAIAVPVNNRYLAPEVEYALRHSGVTAFIYHTELAGHLDGRGFDDLHLVQRWCVGDGELSKGVQPFDALTGEPARGGALPFVPIDDPAMILYTAGTTSRPKGVVHTHASLWNTAAITAWSQSLGSSDTQLTALSMAHGAALSQILTAAYTGCTVGLVPDAGPATILTVLEPWEVSHLALLPTRLADLVDAAATGNHNLSSVRYCTSGGDKVPPPLHDAFRETFGFELTESIGMTESMNYAMNVPFGAKRRGSVGLPSHGTHLRLVNADGDEVAPGEIGEILVLSNANMAGYWNDPIKTEETMRGGWIHTGDLGRVDADGYCYFEGRKKSIIVRGGSNISPAAVEDVLTDHPAVALAAVVGKSDPRYGTRVVAFVQLHPGVSATPGALRAFAAEHLAAYEVPERIVVLDSLPETRLGKIDARALAEQAEQIGLPPEPA